MFKSNWTDSFIHSRDGHDTSDKIAKLSPSSPGMYSKIQRRFVATTEIKRDNNKLSIKKITLKPCLKMHILIHTYFSFCESFS